MSGSKFMLRQTGSSVDQRNQRLLLCLVSFIHFCSKSMVCRPRARPSVVFAVPLFMMFLSRKMLETSTLNFLISNPATTHQTLTEVARYHATSALFNKQ